MTEVGYLFASTVHCLNLGPYGKIKEYLLFILLCYKASLGSLCISEQKENDKDLLTKQFWKTVGFSQMSP